MWHVCWHGSVRRSHGTWHGGKTFDLWLLNNAILIACTEASMCVCMCVSLSTITFSVAWTWVVMLSAHSMSVLKMLSKSATVCEFSVGMRTAHLLGKSTTISYCTMKSLNATTIMILPDSDPFQPPPPCPPPPPPPPPLFFSITTPKELQDRVTKSVKCFP